MKDQQENTIEYVVRKPEGLLATVVESIWMVKNGSEESKQGFIVPDGRIDLFFFEHRDRYFEIFSSGICTAPVIKPPFPRSTMFAVSFHPLAAEYIFKQSFAQLVNQRQMHTPGFWDFYPSDLADFDLFYTKACKTITTLLGKEIDARKIALFKSIDDAKGDITVKELSARVCWSSRQINRYFQAWLGISLKTYLDIIRFSHSLQHLKNGELFPRMNYADQSHFIKEVKKFSGVSPGQLSKNEKDRFIQLRVIPKT